MRYFRYKDIRSIKEEVEALGLDDVITFEEELSSVWREVRIGNKKAWNSFGIHPMEGCDGTPDGRPGDLTFRRYERFGGGGASLIWFEATSISPEGRANPNQLIICEETKGDLERLLAATRKAHASSFGPGREPICGIQLTHSGRYCLKAPVITHHHPVLDRIMGIPCDYPTISDEDLESLEDKYVEAAIIAYEIGFDFVDIKQCHGYLLSELLASKGRDGRYGGDLGNRARFVLNVVGKIREKVGDGLIVATRMNVYDGVPFERGSRDGVGTPSDFPIPYIWGFGCREEDPLSLDLSEPKALARMLWDSGVRMINVSMGNPYVSPHLVRPFEIPPVGGYRSPEHPLLGVARHIEATREIKRAVPEMVVVGSGYSWLRHLLIHCAESNIRKGWVDMVALGRGAIAYPEYVKDLIEKGNMDPRKVCCTVSFCTTLMRSRGKGGQSPTGCALRDEIYREIYRSLRDKEKGWELCSGRP